MLCEDLVEESQARTLAERIVKALAAPFVLSSTQVSVTASVGIAFAGRGDNVPDQVLHDADEAMYQAKRAGGSRHQLIDLRERVHTQTRASLEHDLRGAAVRGELSLGYQPIVRTADGHITGMEALLRWNHPLRGPISPLLLISIAEQTDLVIDIGSWVLEQACADFHRMNRDRLQPPLELHVNVSPHQLMGRDFCQSVERALASTGHPPAQLTLEMTESVYVEDGQRALVVLEDLKRMGVRLALDDFGTGYSSLSYLQRFPIDAVKVDRAYISKLGQDPASGVIVAAVIDLAHALGKAVIAEGVETADQQSRLSSLGCDYCQGYYFAGPMTPDETDQQLRRGGILPFSGEMTAAS